MAAMKLYGSEAVVQRISTLPKEGNPYNAKVAVP